MAKSERLGRVFVNWEQNDASKTMICAYSLRAIEGPFVSCRSAGRAGPAGRGEGRGGLRIGADEAVKRPESWVTSFAT